MKNKKEHLAGYVRGNSVWDMLEQRWLTIDKVNEDNEYPIFLSNESTCTLDGRFFKSDKIPRYFCQQFEIEIPDRAFERPAFIGLKLEPDTPLMVSNDTKTWHPRYFAMDDEDGGVFCWQNGSTSFSGTGTEHWKHWNLATKNDK